MPVVSLERAAVQLGGKTIWHDVTFQIRTGEFVAILGPNGAGKSTLLKAILGLQSLSQGHISVLGHSPRRGTTAVSYLPQRRVFDSDVRIRGRDLVRLGIEGTRWGIPLPGLRALWGGAACATAEERRIQAVIEQVGATNLAGRSIGEVSGGEQQRLLIAQALVTQPRLLLLDEPLDGLDLPNQQAVAQVIQRISREQAVTVLMVAHDVNPILPYLDRVLYMARGQAIIGAPQDIITTETLSRLYNTPVEVLHTSDGRFFVVGQTDEGVSYHAAPSAVR